VLARRLLAVLALLPLPATPPAAASPVPHVSRAAVTVSVPDSLVEGDRFDVTVHISRTHDARRVLLQRWTADFPGAARRWETVDQAKVRGRKRTFSMLAGTDDQERFRARVLYADGKPAMSKPASSAVWHWVDLTEFDRYYSSGGIYPFAGDVSINGTVYRSLWTYTDRDSSEVRLTTGRNCRSVRGVFGVSDKSADGSSAVIRLVSDESTTVVTSTTLTPGMSQPFQVDLPLPYRLAIQMQKTSPAGQAAYPAIGDPELLCTGLSD
jgi:hypothetical protein